MTGMKDAPVAVPSHFYYFTVGTGTWHGDFAFQVTSWRGLLNRGVGLRNFLLATAMHWVQHCPGETRLDSTIEARPDDGTFGVAENTVRLSRFGVTLYLLHERYILDPDGHRVQVEARERFGPISDVLSRTFEYPAEIADGGMASTYFMPLLGTPWTATYRVAENRKQLTGILTCEWARATERAHRV